MNERPSFGRRGAPQVPQRISPVRRNLAAAVAVAPAAYAPDAVSLESAGLDREMIDGTSERSLMALFIGPHTGLYLATFDKLKAASPSLGRLVRTWSWPAFFFTLPWLLYRKLWGVAAGIIILPVVLFYLLPLPHGSSGVFSIVFAMYAKPMYVMLASRTIGRIRAENTDPDVVRDKVERAGGVSMAGGVVGGVIYVVLFILAIIAALAAAATRAHVAH